MGTVLCYVYEEMADFEISLLLHKIRNVGKKEIVSIAHTREEVTAQSGLTYKPMKLIDDIVDLSEVEALIIPGGPINNEQNHICDLANRLVAEGKLVAAICFGPQFLGRAGILHNYLFTTSCSEEKIKSLGCEEPYYRPNYRKERVVIDRNVITAWGEAFVDFAFVVGNYLCIFESKAQLDEQMNKIRNV